MKTTYIEVQGKDLIKGNTYYLDDRGVDKGIYEGTMKGSRGDTRHLFTPIANVSYCVYDKRDYDGQYVGQFSLPLSGWFYIKQQQTE